MTEESNGLALLTYKRYVAGSIPGSDKEEKKKGKRKLAVVNIDILQCVARGGSPRRSQSLPEKRPESPRLIFCQLEG